MCELLDEEPSNLLKSLNKKQYDLLMKFKRSYPFVLKIDNDCFIINAYVYKKCTQEQKDAYNKFLLLSDEVLQGNEYAALKGQKFIELLNLYAEFDEIRNFDYKYDYKKPLKVVLENVSKLSDDTIDHIYNQYINYANMIRAYEFEKLGSVVDN